MRRQFERIDVENGEYQAWDADAHPLALSVAPGKRDWLRLETTAGGPNPKELADAIRRFAQIQDTQVDSSRLESGEFLGVLYDLWSVVRRKKGHRVWLLRWLRR